MCATQVKFCARKLKPEAYFQQLKTVLFVNILDLIKSIRSPACADLRIMNSDHQIIYTEI